MVLLKGRDFSLDFVRRSFELGERILARRAEASRKQNGQFLTPPVVARFMARQLGRLRSGDRILDPALGSGVLACAIVERALLENQPLELWLDGYEIDPELGQTATEILEYATQYAASQGIILHTQVYESDFVLANIAPSQPYLFVAESSNQPNSHTQYNHIIANPPYFKLNRDDPRVKAVTGQIKGHTNIYTLFLALAMQKLVPPGQACFIVPRSFCSGAYFAAFRQDFIEETIPAAVHLFESRQETFPNDIVLQENIIFTFRRRRVRSRQIPQATYLSISTSNNAAELEIKPLSRRVSLKQFLGRRHGTLFFRLPTGELDEQLIETVDSWTGSLNQYGLNVSTGPVVAFRARSWLTDVELVAQNQAVPLLWMQNVKPHCLEWPVTQSNKPQGLALAEEAQSLLIPTRNYVLLRRFSAKEESRRLIAAPFLANDYQYPWIGLENHLNYIYKKQGDLDMEETIGLSAFFNSALIDRYFRIVNGNTQVNAMELRALPLPSLTSIKLIGKEILTISRTQASADPETIVFSVLQRNGHLPIDFPIIRETRITMGKIQEAQELLKLLGLPPAQQNEISALTLLVLAQLSEETSWKESQRQSLRIHDILTEIKERYGREYAENTRETIRRQVIHQFEQAGLVVRNPGDPTLATNSPRTHYALSDAALRAIQAYQSKNWQQAAQDFIESRGALLEIYQKSRDTRSSDSRGFGNYARPSQVTI